MAHATADKMGKRLLSLDAEGEPNIEEIQKLIKKASEFNNEGRAEFNKYVRLANEMQLIYNRALYYLMDGIKGLLDIYKEILLLETLILSDKQQAQAPVIMTQSQYEAWQSREPKTEAEEMLANRVQLYGVATLNRTEGLCINSSGEYAVPDLLATNKRKYGIDAYINDEPTAAEASISAAMKRAKHLGIKCDAVTGIVTALRYNALIEAIAEAAEIPNFKSWQISTDRALGGIKGYNSLVFMLMHTEMQDSIYQITYTSDQRERLNKLLDNEFCLISTELTENLLTDTDKEVLARLAKDFKNLNAANMEVFITSCRIEKDRLKQAAADYMQVLINAEEVE